MEDGADGRDDRERLRSHVQGLMDRAQAGERDAMLELRRFLDTTPELWQRLGDLGIQTEGAWLDLIAGGDSVFREALERQLEALRSELSGASPTPIERLLVARVVATWLQVGHADAQYAQAQGLSLKQAAFSLQRMQAAHRRHLAALKELATLRRLLPAAAARTQPRGPAEQTPVGQRDRHLKIFHDTASESGGEGPEVQDLGGAADRKPKACG